MHNIWIRHSMFPYNIFEATGYCLKGQTQSKQQIQLNVMTTQRDIDSVDSNGNIHFSKPTKHTKPTKNKTDEFSLICYGLK